jgi:hypothetical protein
MVNPIFMCYFLCDSIISDEILLKILELPILVVLDEAYIEFSGLESRMQWVKKHENLIVLRTFSKRAGMLKFLVLFFMTCFCVTILAMILVS